MPSVRDAARIDRNQLGILVFFVSLSVLFGAALLAYVLTRLANPVWRAGLPGLPLGMVASTAFVLGLTASMHWALAAVRENRIATLHMALRLALCFAIAFLAAQTLNWRAMSQAEIAPHTTTLYPFTFFFLTGLHALHVLGGLVAHFVVMRRAADQAYTSSRHAGVRFCTQYWDYLGAVWLVLAAVMWILT